MRRMVPVAVILLAVLLCGCSDDSKEVFAVDETYITGGFADVSPDGRYGLIVGTLIVGGIAQPVLQIVCVVDYETFEYSVLQTIRGATGGAHFCGLNQVAYVRSDVDSVKLMTFDMGEPDYEETLLSCSPADLRFPLSDKFRMQVGVPVVCMESGSSQMVYRVAQNGELMNIRTLDNAAFPSFASGSDELFYFANQYDKEGQSKVWQATLVAYDYVEDSIDTLFGAQSCFGTIIAPEGEDAVYFQSSMPEFDATNVWKYNRANGRLAQITDVAPREFVSNFHVVGDSIAALVKDPSRDSDRQYRYVMYSR